jgi:hypothetical protein
VKGNSVQLPALAVAEPAATSSIRGTNRRKTSPRIDPFGIIGIFLLIGIWQLLTIFVSSSLLPAPHQVARRIANDFFSARELTYFGLPDASLLGSILYTAENVVIAVIVGSVLGAVTGLVTARFRLARSIVDPVVLTAGTVPILVAAPFFLIWFWRRKSQRNNVGLTLCSRYPLSVCSEGGGQSRSRLRRVRAHARSDSAADSLGPAHTRHRAPDPGRCPHRACWGLGARDNR